MKSTLNIEHVINALGIPANRFQSWVDQNLTIDINTLVANPLSFPTHLQTNDELNVCMANQENYLRNPSILIKSS